MRAIYVNDNKSLINWVYSEKSRMRLSELLDIDCNIYTHADIVAAPESFHDVRYIFTTWNFPSFTGEEIRAAFPGLDGVFYAAGSVQDFARPFLECGVKVFSAWGANGVPVAEFTVAQIILAGKGFLPLMRKFSAGDMTAAGENRHFPGNFGEKVGVIGAGMIGKLVISMLKSYRLEVLAFDPFLSDETATALGVRKCPLEELFSECQVVSNHLANNEQTQGMIGYDLFRRMRPYATFINTGRGAQIVEPDLVRILTERPDLTAMLDVTWPEPEPAGHPFYSLPNCFLTPHIAGSSGDEVRRMAEFMLEEYERYAAGQPCRYEVTMKMLETMA